MAGNRTWRAVSPAVFGFSNAVVVESVGGTDVIILKSVDTHFVRMSTVLMDNGRGNGWYLRIHFFSPQ